MANVSLGALDRRDETKLASVDYRAWLSEMACLFLVDIIYVYPIGFLMLSRGENLLELDNKYMFYKDYLSIN